MKRAIVALIGMLAVSACQTTGSSGEYFLDDGVIPKGASTRLETGKCDPRIEQIEGLDGSRNGSSGKFFISADGECLVGEVFYSQNYKQDGKTTLSVMVHGDGGERRPDQKWAPTRWSSIVRERIIDQPLIKSGNYVFAVIARPGYQHFAGKSSGFTPKTEDRYSYDVARVFANAFKYFDLKVLPERIVVFGRSGGCAIGFNAYTLFPEISPVMKTSHFIGEGCPGDYTGLANSKGWPSGRSLSPTSTASKLSKHIKYIAFHGERDKTVPPVYGKNLVDKIKANGGQAEFHLVPIDNHHSLRWSNEFRNGVLSVLTNR